MASSSSSHQQNEEHHAFSGIEAPGKRRKVSESSRLFDVFINHRGPDVKETLARQLYNSLQELGIRAFLDSEEKELGDSFPSTIETAIRSASVHIAIFSKTYAESPWCLAELVLMLESKAKIIPVFYDVEPWEVRHIEKGVYADAFTDYEKKKRYMQMLKEWKEALQSVSFITGEEFNRFSDSKNIVLAVQKEVQRRKKLLVAKYPVGLHNLVEEFERRCLDELVGDFESQCRTREEGKEKAKIVGIFGMGGVGKTTLSRELFNRKKMEYNEASFLFDVREASATNGLPSLQIKLIKDLFKEEPPNFQSAKDGTSYLRNCLDRSSSLSFLIVLDDIDHVDQLDAFLVMDMLNKSVDTLIIVTTRDVGVLISTGITFGYQLKGMNRNDGRELFCWHAFGQPHPASGYDDLVKAFVNVCGGLPLSLQVLGRHVHGRPRNYWSLELKKVKKTLPRDVMQKLKISFDALEYEEKQIFMDIACFFVDNLKSVAVTVWEGSGWNAQHGLETLKDKCLVEEINYPTYIGLQLQWGHTLRMHDHLRDLGREMANEQSHPRRLWHPQDLTSLESKGFKQILAQTKGRCFDSIFDESMGCQITYFLGEPDNCIQTPNSLLWLQLRQSTFEESIVQPSIPSWIPLQHLQYLKIRFGLLKMLWQSHVKAPSLLKELEIFHCPELELSLEGLICLERIIIENCRKLTGVSGISSFTKLVKLKISECPEFDELCLVDMHCLERIKINECRNLKCFEVHGCKKLKRVSGMKGLEKLVTLNIRGCPELEDLADLNDLCCLERITIDECGKLNYLCLYGCQKLKTVSGNFNVAKLRIRHCPELEELPCFARLTCLVEISIVSCGKLKCLELIGCKKLETVEMGGLEELAILNICDSPELKYLPSLEDLSCLEMITIDGCGKLNDLTLKSCKILKRVSGNLDLEVLDILDCPELKELPSLAGLNSLKLRICKILKRLSGNLDLRELEIVDCPELEELPSLARPSSLEWLRIDRCEKLQSIAGTEEMNALISMELAYCSNALVRNCIYKLQCVPSDYMAVIGRAVDGAESTLNPQLFSEAVDADAVIEIDSRSMEASLYPPHQLSAVIVCAILVIDGFTDIDNLNHEIFHSRLEYLTLCYGEWIITRVITDQELINMYDDGLGDDRILENSFAKHGIWKKGCTVMVKKGEEWKTLHVIKTIIDRLH